MYKNHKKNYNYNIHSCSSYYNIDKNCAYKYNRKHYYPNHIHYTSFNFPRTPEINYNEKICCCIIS